MIYSLIFFFMLMVNPLSSDIMPHQNDHSNPAIETDNDRIKQLVEYMKTQNLELESLINDSRFELYDGIGDRFKTSAERRTLSLEEYQRILGFNDKRDRIPGFMAIHSEQLKKAEIEYDIPATVIAAIIGIESDFGKNIGSFNPLNVYVSMYSEDYRADFALAQLEELLKFTERKNIDVFELKSSYAGVMSFAQFIPYSINRWWVGDDIFDMNNNILSIANYLAHFKDITGTIEGAVFRYNPSSLYRDAVMALSAEAERLVLSN